MAKEGLPHVDATTRAAWRQWLAANHATATGAWAVYFKQSAGRGGPTYEELVEEALCFGWVDSTGGKVDALRSKLYFAPRKKGSGWASTNKARVERLAAEGLMAPAGLAAVERAKADGSWALLDASEAAAVGDDLRAAFARHLASEANFEAFPRGVRKAILQWIDQARTPETRAKRVEETARLAAKNERANQWKPKAKPGG